MTTTRIAACLLAWGAAAVVAATPAHALDLSGTITAHEVTTSAIGGTKDVTTVWTLRGGLTGGPGLAIAPATPAVLAFADRTAYTTDLGDPVCYFTTFDGWFPGPQNPVSQDVGLDLRAKDLLTRRATGIIALLGMGPLAQTSSGSCGEAPQPVDPVTLLASENQSDMLYRRAVMGVGNLQLRSGSATTVLAPGDALAPGTVTFRLRAGRWRADGVRVRTGSYRAGILGSGSRTVRVEWHLTSRSPSASCVLPRRSQVRGKTVAATLKLLRRAGFRPGALIPDPNLPVRRGRVSALWDSGLGLAPCGTRVRMWVRR